MDFVDFYHDQDKKIMSGIENAPPFLVNHRAMTDDELSGLVDREFADPVRRLFPIASKAETWRSIAYFNHQAETLISKRALLSPESAAEREKTRKLLVKAAKLWGLDDDETVQLSSFVNLGIHQAEAEEVDPGPGIQFRGHFVPVAKDTAGDTANEFLRHAASIDLDTRENTAGLLLKAAETVGAELPSATQHQLQAEAGIGTCTAGEAANVLFNFTPYIPHKAEVSKHMVSLRQALDRQPADTLLTSDHVDKLASTIKRLGTRYNIAHTAESLHALRTITPAFIQDGVAALKDQVTFPGGVRGSRTSIQKNADRLSTHLSNTHKAEAYQPDEIIAELQKLTPVDLLPLRKLLQG